MNITLVAVGLSVVLFLAAAIDQFFKGGLPAAAFYSCFALTNSATLWVTLK